jgi:hypothetical protein
LQSSALEEDENIVALCYISLNEDHVRAIISFLQAVMKCQTLCMAHEPLDPNTLKKWFEKVRANVSELKNEKRRQIRFKSKLQRQSTKEQKQDLSDFPWIISPTFWQVSLKNTLLQPVSIKPKNSSSWLPVEVRVAEQVVETKLSFDNIERPEMMIEQVVIPQIFSELSQVGVTTRPSPITVTCFDQKGKAFRTQVTVALVSSDQSLPLVSDYPMDITHPCLNKILIAVPLRQSKEKR